MYVIRQLGRLFGTKMYYAPTSWGYRWVKLEEAETFTKDQADKLFKELDLETRNSMFSKFSVVKANV